uniref:NADH-ubiquinone oxidoreductase chain 2 n=1 Tax=Odontocheila batesii TaxID=2021814 RepID=A0A343EYX3_9CARA|nr:NADH dehydrogenase subunit 2 [Odontocheila batesii]
MYLYKMIFILTLMMGTLISVSSSTWLGTWMGLEINLLSFIPLMKEKNNPYSSESSMKYFLIQAMASAVFLFSIILMSAMNHFNSEIYMINEFNLTIINSSLLMKMGAAPFHFWFPEIIEGMNWINSLILMTWQKIAPMMILSYSLKSSNFIMIIIIMCSIIGSLGGLNQTSLRKIMAFSSINHIGWMISSFMSNEMMWSIYFSIYTLISTTIILMLNSFNIFYLSQMFILMNKNILIKFSMLLNFLSLGGLPPFLGFLPKWMIIQQLSNNYSLMILIMILATLITLFFYMRIAYTSIMINHNQMNFEMKNYNLMPIMIIFLTFISLTGLTICTLMFNLY